MRAVAATYTDGTTDSRGSALPDSADGASGRGELRGVPARQSALRRDLGPGEPAGEAGPAPVDGGLRAEQPAATEGGAGAPPGPAHAEGQDRGPLLPVRHRSGQPAAVRVVPVPLRRG